MAHLSASVDLRCARTCACTNSTEMTVLLVQVHLQLELVVFVSANSVINLTHARFRCKQIFFCK